MFLLCVLKDRIFGKEEIYQGNKTEIAEQNTMFERRKRERSWEYIVKIYISLS